MRLCLSNYGLGGLTGATQAELRLGPTFARVDSPKAITTRPTTIVYQFQDETIVQDHVEIRLYGYASLQDLDTSLMGLSNDPGLSGRAVQLFGTAVPEPAASASAAGLLLIGLALGRKWRAVRMKDSSLYEHRVGTPRKWWCRS